MSTTSAVSEVAQAQHPARPTAPAVTRSPRSHFNPTELNLRKAIGVRFALAIELSRLGAREASHECGSPIREGSVTVVYSNAATAADAREEYDGWGPVLELTPLFNSANEPVRAADDRAADALCSGCFYSASLVGVLEDYVVTTKSGDAVTVRYCEGCRQAHVSLQRAVATVRAHRAAHAFGFAALAAAMMGVGGR